MSRQGQNPMRWVDSLSRGPELALTTIVHIPSLDGFWEESLEVLRLSLGSLIESTPAPFELHVFDNGSCREVREYLLGMLDAGQVARLILSERNLGKTGAWNQLFAGINSRYVAYADSDVYFLPGWFERSREILDEFPRAGMVTAQPIPGDLSQHCDSTLAGSRDDLSVQVEEGSDLIPEHYVDSHRRGLGDSEEQYAARVHRRRDVRLRRGDVQAFVSASHFQFLTRSEILDTVFPLPTHRPLGDDRVFDERLDSGGIWRLSTVDYLVHHLGNRRPDLVLELPWHGLRGDVGPLDEPKPSQPLPNWKRRLLESPRLRGWLKALHVRTYQWLYPN